MALAAIAGVGFGCWLRGGSTAMATYDADETLDVHKSGEAGGEIERTGEVLAQLQELATRVASDVGEHSSRVQEINDELAASDKGQTEVVVRAVTRLLEANKKMQQQLESAEDRLQQQAREIESYATLARTDALTRLPNRRPFDAEMARQLAENQRTGRPFCLAMIDVDHFKKFNDTYGHQAGDEVLRGVAEILRQNTSGCEMAARFGGEEFVIIFPATSAADAERRVERIRQAIGAVPCHFAGDEVRIAASLGLAQLLVGETAGELIQRADAALYAAKGGGRNCSYWHDGQTSHRIRQQVSDSHRETPANERPPQPALKQELVKRPEAKLPDASCRTTPQESPDLHRSDSGLPTRMVFCTILRQRLAEWQRGGVAPSIVLVRIDDFDRLSAATNEHLSNLVLSATARHLSACVREGDVVAKYGDATFALLLPGPGFASTAAVAARLRKAVADSELRVDGSEVRFTVSVGGAEAKHGDDSMHLLRRSEEALSASTKSGGNCCYLHNGQWSEMLKAEPELTATAEESGPPQTYGDRAT